MNHLNIRHNRQVDNGENSIANENELSLHTQSSLKLTAEIGHHLEEVAHKPEKHTAMNLEVDSRSEKFTDFYPTEPINEDFNLLEWIRLMNLA